MTICVKCNKDYKTKKMGVVLVQRLHGNPLRAWNCDLAECPGCRHEILTGFGTRPFLQSPLSSKDWKEYAALLDQSENIPNFVFFQDV